jgi:hypothetical protein
MLSEKASRSSTVEGQDDQEEETTIEGLSKKYPWLSLAAMTGESVGPTRKTEETASLFKGKNMMV